MLVDSHCHLDRLDLTAHANELSNAIHAAQQNDVGTILSVSVDLESFPNVLAIAERYPFVFASVGVHPNETNVQEPTFADLVERAAHPKVVAIGETGLDYYRSQDAELTWQQNRFRVHIAAAKTTGKPLIIHMRDATEDTLRILHEEDASAIGGVMHCFSEDWETAQRALALNFYISISGIVTFKNAQKLQDVAKHVPLDRLLIETDAPWLAPVPHRGKPNEPAYVKYTAEFIAQLRGIDYQTIASHTTENFFRLFKGASGFSVT